MSVESFNVKLSAHTQPDVRLLLPSLLLPSSLLTFTFHLMFD